MRSWLFSPGNDQRKLRKALTSGADVVIVDWEDGVPADQRAHAHELARELLIGLPASAPRVVVRIRTGEDAAFRTDLGVLEGLRSEGAQLGGLLLPKVESAREVSEAAPLGLPIIVLVESAYALEKADFLAPQLTTRQGDSPIERLALGNLDLLTDLRVSWEREHPLLAYARARLATLSRAAGLAPPIDGVFPPLADSAGFVADAVAARRVGFGGKLLLHPNQIQPANEAFEPGSDELERARRIVEVFEKAVEHGAGVAVLDGQMIDAPVVAWARAVLARA